MNKRYKQIVLGILFACWGIFLPVHGYGSQVQGIETEGSIHFTGSYQPIGTPEPPETIVDSPIENIAKPGGSLPQTNDQVHSWLFWLGVGLLLLFFIIWKRKNKKTRKRKQENTV